MAERQVSSTHCSVEILTPEGIRLAFSSEDAPSDLLHVSTHNDMAEACGAFTLTFVPHRINGRTYDELIPLRSLVTIRMESPVGVYSKADSTVMVGLTEDQGLAEDWSRGQPQRVVTVSGRSIACVLLDAHLWYHPALQKSPQGTLKVQDVLFNLFWPSDLIQPNMAPDEALRTILTYFLGLKSHLMPAPLATSLEQANKKAQLQKAQPGIAEQELEAQIRQQQTGTARIAKQLAPTIPVGSLGKGQQSVQAFERFKKMNPGVPQQQLAIEFLDQQAGEKSDHALTILIEKPSADIPTSPSPVSATQVVRSHNILLNLQLPGRTLADLLDLNDQTWHLFEDGLRVDVGHNTPYAGSLWNYLHMFIDGLMQEFFTRIEDGICKIFFRPKPFRQDNSLSGTRFADEPTCRSLETADSSILSAPLRRQSANVYNVFNILPLGASSMLHSPSYAHLMAPILLDDPQHPSFLAKYGLRELLHMSPYLSALPTIPSTPAGETEDLVIAAGKRWGDIAAAWYGLAPEMYAGMLTVIGSPIWNIGHRLLCRNERGAREFYVEGVSHDYAFQTGRYITHLRVTRGWYLSGFVDEREG